MMHNNESKEHNTISLIPLTNTTSSKINSQKLESDILRDMATDDSFVLRTGVVDSIKKDDIIIAKGLFSMEEDIKLYIGVKTQCPLSNLEGVIIGPFGKGGKAKVQMNASNYEMKVGEQIHLNLPLSITSGKK